MTDLTNIFGDGFNAEQFDEIKSPFGSGDPQTEFYNYMVSLGYKPNQSIAIGKLTRIHSPDDSGHKKSGWYVFHVMENDGDQSVFGTGCVGSWKDGNAYMKWASKQETAMTPFERESVAQRQKAAYNDFLVEKKRVAQDVADKAKVMWNENAHQASASHAYLKKKKIKAHGIKELNGELIIPVISSHENIMSWQRILPDGSKRFKKGGEKKGGFFRISGDDSVVYLTEGYATAASIHEATGCTVYVAFDSGNLPIVAPIVKSKHGESIIIVAGDNDLKTEEETGKNAGVKAAEDAARAINCSYVTCPIDSDFNDLHCQKGLKAVKKLLEPTEPEVELYDPEDMDIGDVKLPPIPVGAMGAIYNFYQATTGMPSHIFALQSAISICGTFVSREYKTDQMNYSTMFYVNVGESSSGKEHVKNVAEWVFADTGTEQEFEASSGFHSDSGVLNEMSHRVRGLSIIDEMGLYLLQGQAGAAQGTGHTSIRQLMEGVTKTHSKVRTKAYSAGAMVGDANNKVKNNFTCYNPALSVVGMTVPKPFFQAVGNAGIVNGLLSRFIVSIVSKDDGPNYERHKDGTGLTPKPFIDWVNAIRERSGHQIHMASERPNTIEVPFFHNCEPLLREMAEYQYNRYKELQEADIEAMANRVKEWSMRLSLIVALSENPKAEFIDVKHLQWAFDYVKYHHVVLCEYLRGHIASTEYEMHRNEFLNKIKTYGSQGMSQSVLSSAPPFKSIPKKLRMEIIADLVDAGQIISVENKKEGTRGRPTTTYKAIRKH